MDGTDKEATKKGEDRIRDTTREGGRTHGAKRHMIRGQNRTVEGNRHQVVLFNSRFRGQESSREISMGEPMSTLAQTIEAGTLHHDR